MTDVSAAQDTRPQMALLAQYLKDASFESPNTPASLAPGEPSPQIEVTVDIQAKPMGENRYEVALRTTATAKRGDRTAFVAEVVYAGFFELRNFPMEHRQAICLTECPRLIFPFARRVIADMTRDGGFPPLLIDPIDFTTMYQQQLAAAEAQASQPPATA